MSGRAIPKPDPHPYEPEDRVGGWCRHCGRGPESPDHVGEKPTGFYVTVYVEGPKTQAAADELVRAILDVALPGAPEGTTASVVPE